MTNRTDAIRTALAALIATVTGHETHTEALASTSEDRADVTMQHGWDGVSLAYTTAAENLYEIATEIETLREHLGLSVDTLDQIHDDTTLTDVAAHLIITDAHFDIATTSIEAVAVHLDATRTHLETTGEEHLTGLLADLIDDVQTAAQTLTNIRDDVTDELTSTNTSAGGSGGPPSPEPQNAVLGRMTELRRQGHSPQRHGAQITDQQIIDRALYGKDPMTGTTTDGVHGGPHQCSRNATKFTSDEALVKAEKHVRSTSEYASKKADTEITQRRTFVVRVPLADVYGSDYLKHVTGVRRTGSKNHPTGNPPGSSPPAQADLTDGFVHAVFRKTNDGNYNLTTMYPDPKD